MTVFGGCYKWGGCILWVCVICDIDKTIKGIKMKDPARTNMNINIKSKRSALNVISVSWHTNDYFSASFSFNLVDLVQTVYNTYAIIESYSTLKFIRSRLRAKNEMLMLKESL